MLIHWDMSYLEVEEEYSYYSSVDGCIGLHIGVVDHTLDICCIHFHYKVPNSNQMESSCSEGSKQTEQLDFGLQVVGLHQVPVD